MVFSLFPDIYAKNLSLAFVTQGTPAEAKVFCDQRAPGILCLSDPEREAYDAYGLERASVWQSFLSLDVWRSNRRLKRERGWNTELPPKGQDAMQMAGTFVIARDGTIRLPYYYDHIADHPSVDLVLHGVMRMVLESNFQRTCCTIMKTFFLASYLALKEVFRYRGRFLLFSLVIALITLLVLFIAALGEGLANGNRQYLANLDAQLIVFLEKSDFIIPSSRLETNTTRTVRRVDGVANAGPIYTSNTEIVSLPEPLKVSMLGVEPGEPGMPKVISGTSFRGGESRETVIERNVALRSGIKIGDEIEVRSTQGTEDNFFKLKVVGLVDGQSYGFQPTIFVPPATWEKVRPQSEADLNSDTPYRSECMAILSIANDLADLKKRLNEITVAFDKSGKPVTTGGLEVGNAMAAFMRNTINPTLMCTAEYNPCFVHAGPFANIAVGHSSIIADRIGLKLFDYHVTESGFAADIGFEKFWNVKCRNSGLKPQVSVLTTTVRALKMHGGGPKVVAGKPIPAEYTKENVGLFEKGCANLVHMINVICKSGINPARRVGAWEAGGGGGGPPWVALCLSRRRCRR